jgi:hypothetical protein
VLPQRHEINKNAPSRNNKYEEILLIYDIIESGDCRDNYVKKYLVTIQDFSPLKVVRNQEETHILLFFQTD